MPRHGWGGRMTFNVGVSEGCGADVRVADATVLTVGSRVAVTDGVLVFSTNSGTGFLEQPANAINPKAISNIVAYLILVTFHKMLGC